MYKILILQNLKNWNGWNKKWCMICCKISCCFGVSFPLIGNFNSNSIELWYLSFNYLLRHIIQVVLLIIVVEVGTIEQGLWGKLAYQLTYKAISSKEQSEENRQLGLSCWFFSLNPYIFKTALTMWDIWRSNF